MQMAGLNIAESFISEAGGHKTSMLQKVIVVRLLDGVGITVTWC